VLLPFAGAPLVRRVLERVAQIPGIDEVCLAIPPGPQHRALADLAHGGGWRLIEGPEDDVLRRYRLAADATGAEHLLRVTSDCPLIDPGICGALITLIESTGLPYVRTAIDTGFPLGLDAEVMNTTALHAADGEAEDPYEREHVTPFIWRRPQRFPALLLDRRPDRRAWRLTIDMPEDYAVVRPIFETAYAADPHFDFTWIERYLLEHPMLLAGNAHIARPAFVGLQHV